MESSIGILNANRQEVVNVLAKLLADEYVLYTKTRNAHWNVEGLDFSEKHAFFEVQFRELDVIIDRVAERIRSLGHYAPASLKIFLNTTHLSETSYEQNDSKGFIKELLIDHDSIIIFLRENITPFADTYKDVGTSDFITGIIEEHEKMAWILRTHLK
ncbi:Dps family protein [Runella sp.]|uniref:Dps family protein n=1 Tax=Runella sp. TaxID=1960881 RepID=UPI003D095CF1